MKLKKKFLRLAVAIFAMTALAQAQQSHHPTAPAAPTQNAASTVAEILSMLVPDNSFRRQMELD